MALSISYLLISISQICVTNRQTSRTVDSVRAMFENYQTRCVCDVREATLQLKVVR